MNETTRQILQAMADKLNTTVPQLWQILLNQARIDGVINITISLSISTLLFLVAKKVRPSIDTCDDFDKPLVKCGHVLLILAAGVIITLGVGLNISQLIYPQGTVLQQILGR